MNKYIIFGTGSVAEKYYLQIVNAHGHDSIEFFLDSMLNKSEFCGKEVKHLDYLNKINVRYYTYILGSIGSTLSMKQELLSRGVPERNILEYKYMSEENMYKNINHISNILLYPQISDIQTLTRFQHLVTRDIPLYKEAGLKFYILTNEEPILERIKSCDYFAHATDIELKNYDIILVWDYMEINSEIIHRYEHIYCIDPLFYFMMDRKAFIRLNYKIGIQLNNDYYKSISIKNYNKLKQRKASRSYIFGNGPSMNDGIVKYEQLKSSKNDPALTIVCNAFILSGTEIINRVKPDIYALIELLFLTEKYDDITQNIINFVIETECILLVPDFWMPYLCSKYKNIAVYLLGIGLDASTVNIPDENNLSIYYKAGNVVTGAAIPIASALSDSIYISGCDGINLETDTGNIWQHSDMADHKIITSQNDYDSIDTYIKHNCFFDEIVKYGEGRGKKYYSITYSNIPVLKEHSY